jgi:hypothetical protein
MTQSQLIHHISSFGNRIQVVKFRNQFKEENLSLNQLVDLTFYPDKAIATKASRILQFIMIKFPQNYLDEMGYLFEHAPDVKCSNCLKHYARIMMRITSPDVIKEVRSKLKGIDLEPVVELCFQWLDDPKMFTSVRSSAAEALFNMRHRYPWIAEGLSRRLEAMMPKATPLMRAKGNYILSFLHPED